MLPPLPPPPATTIYDLLHYLLHKVATVQTVKVPGPVKVCILQVGVSELSCNRPPVATINPALPLALLVESMSINPTLCMNQHNTKSY